MRYCKAHDAIWPKRDADQPDICHWVLMMGQPHSAQPCETKQKFASLRIEGEEAPADG